MKKVYKTNKLYYQRCAYLRDKRRRISSQKAKNQRRVESFRRDDFRHAIALSRNNFVLVLPEEFGFNINHGPTSQALYELRELVEREKTRLRIDFSQIKVLGSTASLALAGEIYRWRSKITAPLVTKRELWNDEVKLALYQMGLFELLGVAYDGKGESSVNRTFIKFIFGSKTDGQSAKEIRLALQEVSKANIDSGPSYIGLTEAMTNVVQHAYRNIVKMQKVFGVNNPWWLGGSYTAESDTLSITLCDQGVGIPKTLPRSHPMERVNKLLSAMGVTEPDDAAMIEAAIEIGRTQTKLPQHGKGLKQIREFVDSYQDASFKILSLRGEYLYLRVNGESTSKRTTHGIPIRGTIIEWKIKNISKDKGNE